MRALLAIINNKKLAPLENFNDFVWLKQIKKIEFCIKSAIKTVNATKLKKF